MLRAVVWCLGMRRGMGMGMGVRDEKKKKLGDKFLQVL
jgi:hypothetical protein